MKPSPHHLSHLALALALIFAFALVLPMPGGLSTTTAFAAAGPVCYVNASATGAATGASWADAYTTVQDALADTNCTEIWVAKGVYYPDEGSGQTNDDRTSTFRLKNGVALYGGFAGTETARDQRAPAANVTVLSGDIDHETNPDTTDANGVVTDTANINGNNAYSVVSGINTDNTAVLDGFTVTAGQANGSYSAIKRGGGMENEGGSSSLTGVTFSGNLASDVGGGMYNDNSSNPTLNNVTFSSNSANDGGGMYNDGGSHPTLNNVTFSNNSASNDGGGMYTNGSATLNDVTFSNNSANDGGGMYNSSNPTLHNVTFSNNSASNNGGGMYNDHTGPTLNNVTFSSNSASNNGGGIYNDTGSPRLTDVVFSYNSASDGGGMYSQQGYPILTDTTFSHNSASDSGGGMFNRQSSPHLTDSTFSDNSAGYGGGMSNEDSNPELTDVTFSSNSADYGGGMENHLNSTPSLTNVTFSNNLANSDGGGMENDNSSPHLVNVTFSGNSASGDGGGGMDNFYHSNPDLLNVTFSNNSARNGGGMLNVSSNPTLTHVTFSANSASGRYGGGGMINDTSSPTLVNVTFSGNSASSNGGGMENLYDSNPALVNVTFSNNSASAGGGMFNDSNDSNHPSVPTLINVIIANSTSGGDCVNGADGAIAASSTHNLIEDSAHACGLTNGTDGNTIGSDPALGVLTDFGGPGKQVFPLLAGSPAIDTGTNSGCPSTDQRGVTRPVGAACDIGAYEYDTPPVVATHSLQASYTASGPSSFTVTFSKAVANPAGNSGQDDVTNPANYLLVEKGSNGTADTTSCASGVAGDDVQQAVTSVSYNETTFTATVTLAGALPAGSYRLFVCGTTSIVDTANNPLNNGLSDATFDFIVQSRAASLPKTGFRHDQITPLPAQPVAKAYTTTTLTLIIPKLGVSLPIVGVPASADGWDVTWLGNDAGWLEGSAFPTWAGNTVLTGHVWDAYNQPGPFAELKTLHYGDTIEIHAWGQVYVYEVRETGLFSGQGQAAINAMLKHETYDVITLVTCEGYNQQTGDYAFRRMVRAVLVDVR